MCIYIYIYVCVYVYIYIYIYIHTLIEFKFINRAFRAYPLVEIRQTLPRRAIRGNSISVNSTLPSSERGLPWYQGVGQERDFHGIRFAGREFHRRRGGANELRRKAARGLSIKPPYYSRAELGCKSLMSHGHLPTLGSGHFDRESGRISNQ